MWITQDFGRPKGKNGEKSEKVIHNSTARKEAGFAEKKEKKRIVFFTKRWYNNKKEKICRGRARGKRSMNMAKITADTLIVDCLKYNPDSAQILMSYGMHCLGCAMAHGETIGEAVNVHGNDLDELLEKLNEGIDQD